MGDFVNWFVGFALSLFISHSISAAPVDPNKLPRVDWNIVSTSLNIKGYVYSPFFVNGQEIVLYTGGSGVDPGNGVLKLTSPLSGSSLSSEKRVVGSGPDLAQYNYFRAPRVAKSGNELWMLVEVSGCYTGCDSTQFPKSLAAYRSMNNGQTWSFLNFVNVNGQRYVSQWFAHTGLVYNPQGSTTLDLVNLPNNRFVTIGENRDIFVSADGVSYTSVPMNHPFPKDRLVFASLAKTPYGYHLTSSANWNDAYYTTTVRHLFSKDLKNWVPIESNSYLKNPLFYKGIHLSYDEVSGKLWALSPCGSDGACGFVAWLEPKDYSNPALATPPSELVPVGEFVHINGKTAMITGHVKTGNIIKYKIRLADGTYDSGYTKEMFVLPLASYKRQGCFVSNAETICVGDAVYVGGNVASIMGIHDSNPSTFKYALKFANGVVDTGYTRPMLQLP
jgi:hypothetical protein